MNTTKSIGNMYKEITDMWKPITGECGFGCKYCSTRKIVERYDNKLQPAHLNTPFPDLGQNKKWFVCSTIDMFHYNIERYDIYKILDHCGKYPNNLYLFQSKNPDRFLEFTNAFDRIEQKSELLLETIIESNRTICKLYADIVYHYWQLEKIIAMRKLKELNFKTQITIEPIMDFDLLVFSWLLQMASPDIIYIGADSKNCGLPEPSCDDIKKLIDGLKEAGLNVILKSNLKRLVPDMESLC